MYYTASNGSTFHDLHHDLRSVDRDLGPRVDGTGIRTPFPTSRRISSREEKRPFQYHEKTHDLPIRTVSISHPPNYPNTYLATLLSTQVCETTNLERKSPTDKTRLTGTLNLPYVAPLPSSPPSSAWTFDLPCASRGSQSPS